MIENTVSILIEYKDLIILSEMAMLLILLFGLHEFPSYKNYKMGRRLFRNKKYKSNYLFNNCHTHLEGIIRELNIIKQYMSDGNEDEVATRCKNNIAAYGLTPPETPVQCEQMIRDLRAWRP